jgi:hypothetical protein
MRVFAKDGSYPTLVHCAHGKDRTGVIIMLLLLVCDTPHEAIVQDYVQVWLGTPQHAEVACARRVKLLHLHLHLHHAALLSAIAERQMAFVRPASLSCLPVVGKPLSLCLLCLQSEVQLRKYRESLGLADITGATGAIIPLNEVSTHTWTVHDDAYMM